MGSSWRLGRLQGITVQIHWTFLLLPLWVFGSSVLRGGSVQSASVSVILLLSVFGCVVLHELGHALMARRFGIATRDITLLPIGGVARLARMPRDSFQEFAIAVAGPAVNVVIAMLLSLAFVAAWSAGIGAEVLGFIIQLAWINIALVLFNLIPAFPMDGGRILRSLLALVTSYRKATHIAVGVGQVAAAALGVLGLVGGNIMLVFLAGFVFIAAAAEARNIDLPSQEIPPREVLLNNDEAGDHYRSDAVPPPGSSLPHVSATWDVHSAQRWMDRKPSHDFIVVKDGVAIGRLSKTDLLYAIGAGDGRCPIERLLGRHRFTRASQAV